MRFEVMVELAALISGSALVTIALLCDLFGLRRMSATMAIIAASLVDGGWNSLPRPY